MQPSDDAVLYETRGDVRWLTLNRPAALNAVTQESWDAIGKALNDFEADRSARVLVITGAGQRAFCAGADVKRMVSDNRRGPRYVPPMPIAGRNVRVTKPIIAAVNGLAYGAGFLITQMADLCVAAEHATFAIPEAKLGRGAPWGAPLPWMIPPRVVLELMMTAEPMSAQRACEIGFVNRVVPQADLVSVTTELAERIAGNAPATIRAAKEFVYGSLLERDAIYDFADRVWDAVYESPDAAEGPRAFREHRKPEWTDY